MRIFSTIVLIFTLLSGCISSNTGPNTAESVISDSKNAIVRITYNEGSCTGFHIGYNLFATAAHCFWPGPYFPISDINIIRNTEKLSAEIVTLDFNTDVALLISDNFSGPSLELYQESIDGPLTLGRPVIALGYPGYNNTILTFEDGLIKQLAPSTITTRDMIYFGESGGPLIDLKSGKVIGIAHALYEHQISLGSNSHQHYTESLYKPINKLEELILKEADFYME